MSMIDPRVRRPEHHELLIQQLRNECNEGGAGFPAIRDVLLFAAGVGYTNGRRLPFDKSGEPIRYDILTYDALAEPFVAMLAAVSVDEDPEVLEATRLHERIKIFEEYANGGLEYLQEQVNTRKEPLDVIVSSITVEELSDASQHRNASIEELLGDY